MRRLAILAAIILLAAVACIQAGTVYYLLEVREKVDFFMNPRNQLRTRSEIRIDELQAKVMGLEKRHADLVDSVSASRELERRKSDATDAQIARAEAEAARANAKALEPCIIHGIC